MPVVTVHHLRLPPIHLAQMLHQRQHATREKNEPAIVVALPVDRLAFERRGNIEQVHGRFAVGQRPNPQLFLPLANRQEGRRDRPLYGHPTFAQLAKVGHHDPHVVPGAAQRGREGTGHIGQSARLDEWCDFSGREKDVHAWKM